MEPTLILQNPVFTKFLFPFVLIFFIVFAILKKTKVLGEGTQVNAVISFVIGLIFVGAIFPKEVVENLILFMSIAIVSIFVVLLIWGFATGTEGPKFNHKFLQVGLGILAVFGVVMVILWVAGYDDNFWNFISGFFTESWSETFWTNVIFILVIAAALAVVLKYPGGSGGEKPKSG